MISLDYLVFSTWKYGKSDLGLARIQPFIGMAVALHPFILGPAHWIALLHVP